MRRFSILMATCSLLIACGGDDDIPSHNEGEVITTVTLTFTPSAGGDEVVAAFDDPDGDGGNPPTIDRIALSAGTNYVLAVSFENRLEDPPEDITAEVADEGDEHQVFFTGTAVSGPASDQPGAPLTHAYTDEDPSGLPLGLESSIATVAGTGDLFVTLRHLPPINGTPVKTADTASDVKQGGFSAIAGATDAQVNFPVTVQ